MEDFFDELSYLTKYPDVAAAVKAGIMPSGEYHYKKYGKQEGRNSILISNDVEILSKDPKVSRFRKIESIDISKSKVWRAYKAYAPFHPELDNLDMFNFLMTRLINGDNFHVARYNDGEWVFMLQIQPYFSRYIKNHKHYKKEVTRVSQEMLSIIDSAPPYYIGIDSTTRALQGLIAYKKQLFLEKISNLQNVIYGDIFNAATVRLGINALLDPLAKRFVISVGPTYMARLGANTHIQVPQNNCWHKQADVENLLNGLLQQHLAKNPVVIYSCSLLAKVLIDTFYKKYTNSITQIDIGSAIDPWCGVISRPWHPVLVQHYNLYATPDGFART